MWTRARRALGLPRPEGLLVTECPVKGEMKPGDVILALNGQPVADRAAYLSLLRNRQPGELVRADIVRRGKTITLSLKALPFSDKEADRLAERRWGVVPGKAAGLRGMGGLYIASIRESSPAHRSVCDPAISSSPWGGSISGPGTITETRSGAII